MLLHSLRSSSIHPFALAASLTDGVPDIELHIAVRFRSIPLQVMNAEALYRKIRVRLRYFSRFPRVGHEEAEGCVKDCSRKAGKECGLQGQEGQPAVGSLGEPSNSRIHRLQHFSCGICNVLGATHPIGTTK